MHTIIPVLAGGLMLAACSLPSISTDDGEAGDPDVSVMLDVSEPGPVRIVIGFAGDESGTSRLKLSDDFGFTTPDPAWFDDFTVECRDTCATTFDPEALIISITHAPGDRLDVSYTLASPLVRPEEVDDYRPLVGEDGVHLFTPVTVFLPTHIIREDAGLIEVATAWRGVEERGWQAHGPLGPGAARLTGELNGERLQNSLYAAGPGGASVSIGETGLLAAQPMPGAGEAPEELLSLIEPVILETRAMFEDVASAGDWYFVTFSPAGPDIENGFALGGTAVTSAFALYYTPGLSFGPEGAWAHGSIQNVVAHEFFHNWNGVLFFLDDSAQKHSTRWFVEGFTSFYARELMHRSGLYSDEAYLENLNAAVVAYRSADHRDLSNQELVELWSENDPRAFMSYTRGELIALILDEALRADTDGDVSLDDLMRQLARQAFEDDETRPSDQIVYDWIGEQGGEALADQLHAYVDEGVALDLPVTIPRHGLVLDDETGLYAFDQPSE